MPFYFGAHGPLQTDSQLKSKAANCFLFTISFVCLFVVVACWVGIIGGHSNTVDYYKWTSCWVDNVTYLPDLITCDICPGYNDQSKRPCSQSQFPCVRIHVGYQVKAKVYRGLLHQNNLHASRIYGECSFNVCMKDIEENRMAVTHHADGWLSLKNNHFDCLYNSEDSYDVISHNLGTQPGVTHCMLLPFLVLVVCCGIFLSIERRRLNLTCCGRRESAIESNRTSTDLN